MEHKSPGGMIGSHLVVFPKDPETPNGDGTDQVVGLIVLLLPWWDFYVFF